MRRNKDNKNINNNEIKQDEKISRKDKMKSFSTVEAKDKNRSGNSEFINIESDKKDKKLSFFEKLSIILREDDLNDYVWILNTKDEDDEETDIDEAMHNCRKRKKNKKKNKDDVENNLSIDDRFMQYRLKKTILYSITFLIVLATFYLVNYLFLHLHISPFLYILSFLVFVFICFKINYFSLKKKFNKKRDEVYNSFPLWVSTLQILILTNNITNTFKKSLSTCPKAFKKDLEKFVKDIEFDPDNKEHYKNFLKRYKIEEINEIIMDMYIFNRMDKNEIVHQFTVVNDRLNKIQNNIRKKKQEQSLFFIAALNSIPLMTASIYVLLISMMLASV